MTLLNKPPTVNTTADNVTRDYLLSRLAGLPHTAAKDATTVSNSLTSSQVNKLLSKSLRELANKPLVQPFAPSSYLFESPLLFFYLANYLVRDKSSDIYSVKAKMTNDRDVILSIAHFSPTITSPFLFSVATSTHITLFRFPIGVAVGPLSLALDTPARTPSDTDTYELRHHFALGAYKVLEPLKVSTLSQLLSFS